MLFSPTEKNPPVLYRAGHYERVPERRNHGRHVFTYTFQIYEKGFGDFNMLNGV